MGNIGSFIKIPKDIFKMTLDMQMLSLRFLKIHSSNAKFQYLACRHAPEELGDYLIVLTV